MELRLLGRRNEAVKVGIWYTRTGYEAMELRLLDKHSEAAIMSTFNANRNADIYIYEWILQKKSTNFRAWRQVRWLANLVLTVDSFSGKNLDCPLHIFTKFFQFQIASRLLSSGKISLVEISAKESKFTQINLSAGQTQIYTRTIHLNLQFREWEGGIHVTLQDDTTSC